MYNKFLNQLKNNGKQIVMILVVHHQNLHLNGIKKKLNNSNNRKYNKKINNLVNKVIHNLAIKRSILILEEK